MQRSPRVSTPLTAALPLIQCYAGHSVVTLWHDRLTIVPVRHLRRYCNACFVVPQVHSPHAVVEVLITVKGVTHEQPIFVSQFTIQQMLEFVGRKCWVSGDQLTEDRPDTPCAVQIYPSLEYSKVPWYPHCAVLRRSHIRSESSSHTSCQRLRLSHLRQDGQFCRRNRIWLNLTQSLTSLINLTH